VTADDRARPVEGVLERAIAVQVRRHRRARGLTVGELALRAGISKAMLSKIENSLTSSSLTTVARLAAALDVPVTDLFHGADGARGGARRLEAHLVTLTERSAAFPPLPGAELLVVLEGVLVYGHGGVGHTLGPGDALALDGDGAHGPQELLALPVRILAVGAVADRPD
jgi:transcriptional regulator with XRE-family HTH domain